MYDVRERDNDEIKPVPCVPEIVKWTKNEATGEHFHRTLDCVDCSEYLSDGKNAQEHQ